MPSCACRCASRSRNCICALGQTTLYVTHDQVEAMTLADRLIVMNKGKAEQIGDAARGLQPSPGDRIRRGFIGSPNLLPARVAGGKARIGTMALPLPPGIAAPEGREIVWGVRPEHMVIASDAAPDFTIDVDLVEALGADTLVHGRIADATLTVRLPGSAVVKEGDRVPLALAPDAVHAFDKATGKRL
jgi:sn-glycerol 3-phosphate transport system ATP-binding protein